MILSLISYSRMANRSRTPSAAAVDAVAGRLSRRSTRFTRARRCVVEALVDADGPLTAAELHQLLAGEVPLSSLYRSLAVLERTEVLARRHDAGGVARYEPAEWLTGHHHHLVCTSCGTVEDVAVDPDIEATVSGLIAGLARHRGYEPSGHRIDIEGLCPGCRTG